MDSPQINKLFRLADKQGSSELVLQPGSAPVLKLGGQLTAAEMRPLTQADLDFLILPILDDEQRSRLEQEEEVVVRHSIDVGHVYQVTVSRKNGQLSLSGRRLVMP